MRKNTKQIQCIVDTLLYCAQSVDPTMLREINKISRVQSRPKKDTNKKASMLLDYAATYLNLVYCYHASDLFLLVDSYPA